MFRAAPWLAAAIVLTTSVPDAAARSGSRQVATELTLGATIAARVEGALSTLDQVEGSWRSRTARLARRWRAWATGLARWQFRTGAVVPWLRETGVDLDQVLDAIDPRAVLPRFGLQPYRMLVVRPVPGKITSEFGYRRDPFRHHRKLHKGLDLRGDRGDPVHAAAAGVVIRASRWRGYGNCIVIDHGMGIETRYGHLSKIRVREGDFVAANAFIGAVGSTGRATGPHLHFEVRQNDVPIDPRRAFVDLRTFMDLPPAPPEPSNTRELLDSWRRRHDIRKILKPSS